MKKFKLNPKVTLGALLMCVGSFSTQAATIGFGTTFGSFLDKDGGTLTTGGVSVGFFTKSLPTAAAIASLNNASPLSFSTFQTEFGYVDVRTMLDANNNAPTFMNSVGWDFGTGWTGDTLTVPGTPNNAPNNAFNQNDSLTTFASGSTAGTALWAVAYNGGNYANGYAGSTQWAVVTATAPGQSSNDWIYPSGSNAENIQLVQINLAAEVIVGTDTGNSNIYLVIPEPNTATLLVSGFLLLVVLRRRAGDVRINSLVKAGSMILVGMFSFAVSGHAQSTVSTPVVGFQKITLPVGGKAIAPTFIKANVFSGTATISGTTISVASGALSGLSLGPTAFSNRANYPKYYAEVTDTNSPFYGYNFDIASHISSANSFSSDNLPSQMLNGVAVPLSGSVTIAIRPHITLADLSPASLADGDSVTMANDPSGATSTFYVYNGGWIGADFDPNKSFSHVIIPPGSGFLYSGQSSELQLTLSGTVKSTPTAVPLYQNAYANLVAPVNPSSAINYVSQNIASGIGTGAAFTIYSNDGNFVEDKVFYSTGSALVDGSFQPAASVSVDGGVAVAVGALNSDSIWMIPAAINQ